MRRPWLIVLGLTKIDWLEPQRSIEGIRARSARRRALLSQSGRQGGKRALLGLLQLRHSRRRIWEAGHRPCRVNDDCFPRVISHDDPSIPGRDLKCAVRQVFVRYGAIIQEREHLAQADWKQPALIRIDAGCVLLGGVPKERLCLWRSPCMSLTEGRGGCPIARFVNQYRAISIW